MATEESTNLSLSTTNSSHESEAPQICPPTNDEDIFQAFQLEATVQWIRSNGFKQIALQFPDKLLFVAPKICEQLCKSSGEFCFILGDSSYSSCCVDEVAGQRFAVDALVHYGHACLTQTTPTLPIFYVFRGPNFAVSPVDSPAFNEAISSLREKLPSNPTLLITYDLDQWSIARAFCNQLKDELHCVVWSEPSLPEHCFSASVPAFIEQGHPPFLNRCSRNFYSLRSTRIAEPPWCLVHLGSPGISGELLPVYRVLLSFPEVASTHSFYVDTTSFKVDCMAARVRGLLKRRLHAVERAKSAKQVGILIGTLSVSNYRDMVQRVQTLLKRANRSYVTLHVGRLNPTKLASLPELEVLVLIACPESTLLDSRDLWIPVITPYELECALHSPTGGCLPERVYTGERYWVDFRDLLKGGPAYCPEDAVVPSQLAEQEADMSLVSGKVFSHNLPSAEASDAALVERAACWTLADSGVDGFTRTWYGLDPQLGETPVSVVQEGLHGVPTGYTHAVDESGLP